MGDLCALLSGVTLKPCSQSPVGLTALALGLETPLLVDVLPVSAATSLSAWEMALPLPTAQQSPLITEARLY